MLPGLSVCQTSAEIARKEGRKLSFPGPFLIILRVFPEFMGVEIMSTKIVLGSVTAY